MQNTCVCLYDSVYEDRVNLKWDILTSECSTYLAPRNMNWYILNFKCIFICKFKTFLWIQVHWIASVESSENNENNLQNAFIHLKIMTHLVKISGFSFFHVRDHLYRTRIRTHAVFSWFRGFRTLHFGFTFFFLIHSMSFKSAFDYCSLHWNPGVMQQNTLINLQDLLLWKIWVETSLSKRHLIFCISLRTGMLGMVCLVRWRCC